MLAISEPDGPGCGTTRGPSELGSDLEQARHILPGPSPLWLDATGARLPAPLLPGFDTLGTLDVMTTGHDYTWFVLTQKMIEKEFALSGSERNPTRASWTC